MGVYIVDKKTFNNNRTNCFDLSKDTDSNLEDEIYSIIKHNELFAKHTEKNEVRQSLSKYNHGNNILKTKSSKISEPHKFVFNLPQILDLSNLNKHVYFQNLFIYYIWKNIR